MACQSPNTFGFPATLMQRRTRNSLSNWDKYGHMGHSLMPSPIFSIVLTSSNTFLRWEHVGTPLSTVFFWAADLYIQSTQHGDLGHATVRQLDLLTQYQAQDMILGIVLNVFRHSHFINLHIYIYIYYSFYMQNACKWCRYDSIVWPHLRTGNIAISLRGLDLSLTGLMSLWNWKTTVICKKGCIMLYLPSTQVLTSAFLRSGWPL